jgi:putative oxidoreductase
MNASTALERGGLVPLRLVVGLVFLMHGGQKFFIFGAAGTADILDKLGIPLPAFFAVVVTAVELLGGLAILLGVFVRLAGLLLAFEMVVAILVARLKGGFFTPYGYEFEMTLLGACLTMAAIGPGGISIESLLRRARSTPGTDG